MCCLATKSCPNLCQVHKTPLSMGFPRQEHWSGLPFPSPGDLPDPGIKPTSPALGSGFFTAKPPRKPPRIKCCSVAKSCLALCHPVNCNMRASLSITVSLSFLKLMCIESVRVFSSESALCIRWPKYWSFSFSISPSNEYSGLISFRTDWISLQSKGLSSLL